MGGRRGCKVLPEYVLDAVVNGTGTYPQYIPSSFYSLMARHHFAFNNVSVLSEGLFAIMTYAALRQGATHG